MMASVIFSNTESVICQVACRDRNRIGLPEAGVAHAPAWHHHLLALTGK